MYRLTLSFLLVLIGCSSSTPIVPTADGCEQMCQHIGPEGLNCEEGQPVYDSALPGPVGVPNESCVILCEKLQSNGVDLKTGCVSKVPSCDLIESYRQRCN